MYSPKAFAIKNPEKSLKLMMSYPFATLISGAPTEMQVSHIPLIVSQKGDQIILQGHFARANSHWRTFKPGASALAVFHGPNRYISSSWYLDPREAPTWNYGVVHALGKIRMIEDIEWLNDFLSRLVGLHEDPSNPDHWKFDPNADYVKSQIKAIVGFEIAVESLETKLKLSQNRSPEDQLRVLKALKAAGDENSLAMAGIIQENLDSK